MKPVKEIVFKATGTVFMAYREAEYWCKQNGYSYGSMCHPQPTAIFKGDVYVAKWKNLTSKERNSVDGIITGDDYREGDITIILYER